MLGLDSPWELHSCQGQANRLLEDDAFTYSYDANGNLTRKVERATAALTTYTYDGENQLTRIDLPDGRVATYRYDGLGLDSPAGDHGLSRPRAAASRRPSLGSSPATPTTRRTSCRRTDAAGSLELAA